MKRRPVAVLPRKGKRRYASWRANCRFTLSAGRLLKGECNFELPYRFGGWTSFTVAPCWSLMMRTLKRVVPSRSLVLRLA